MQTVPKTLSTAEEKRRPDFLPVVTERNPYLDCDLWATTCVCGYSMERLDFWTRKDILGLTIRRFRHEYYFCPSCGYRTKPITVEEKSLLGLSDWRAEDFPQPHAPHVGARPKA